jgi:copper chaperone CopZ
MDRRDFMCGITATSGAAVSLSTSSAAKETRSITYTVQGFTCVTCAVGLEVMLRQQKGVVRANASYPERTVAIGFDETLISEKALKGFIVQCGFSVA